MIQRIQSLYLLVATLCTAALFFVPMYFLSPGELSATAETFRYGITGVYQLLGSEETLLYRTLPLMFIVAIAGSLLLAAIFMYRKRPFQANLVRIALLLLLASALFQLWSTNTLRGSLAPGHTYNFSTGWVLLAVIFITGFLAIRGIKKDEALVRSADRLR
jgi:hypothetical protein